MTLSTGWTYRGLGTHNQQHSSTALSGSVCAYVLTSADISGGVSWTFTIPAAISWFVGQITAYAGIDATTNDGVDVCSDAASAPAASSFTTPTITPSSGSRAILEGAACRTGSADNGATLTVPGADTLVGSVTSAGGNPGRQIYSVTADLTANPITGDGSSTFGGGTFTASPNTNTINNAYAWSMALKVSGGPSTINHTGQRGATARTFARSGKLQVNSASQVSPTAQRGATARHFARAGQLAVTFLSSGAISRYFARLGSLFISSNSTGQATVRVGPKTEVTIREPDS